MRRRWRRAGRWSSVAELLKHRPAMAPRRAGRDAADAEDGLQDAHGESGDPVQGARPFGQRHAVHRRRHLDDRQRRQPHGHTGQLQGVPVELRRQVLREISPEGTGPSGIGVDEDNRTIWIGSTYSREIIRADAKTGETIEKHFTPGAGVIYRRNRPTSRRGRIRTARRRAPGGDSPREAGRVAAGRRGGGGGRRRCARHGQNSGQATQDGLGVGRGGAIAGNPGPPAPGTGAHGQQTQNGKLWMAVPPGRMIYRVDPEDLDRGAHVSHRRVPAARHRHRDGRREVSLGIGHATWARSSSATW